MIRRLSADDLAAFRALWEDGLERFPAAFLLTPGEVRAIPDARVRAQLSSGSHWGAFEADALVGLGVLRRGGVARLQHTGDIGPLYVAPDAQGRGHGRALMRGMLEGARQDGLLQVELCVDASNAPALRLYRGLGFAEIGRRPRSVIIDGIARDDLILLKRLDTPS
ncbi:N-acetyltransferase family protein [Roseobacteraceae bacterium S113]